MKKSLIEESILFVSILKWVAGAIITVQTFCDFLGFNPHCHILVTDGCFYGNR